MYAMLDAFVGDETADVNDDTVGAVMSEMFVLIVCALEVTPPAVAVYVKESAPDETPPGVKVNAPVADVMAAVPLVPWVPRAKVTLPDGSYPGRKPENEPTSDIASVVGDARVGTVAEVDVPLYVPLSAEPPVIALLYATAPDDSSNWKVSRSEASCLS